LAKPQPGILNWDNDIVIENQALGDHPQDVDWDDIALNIGAEVVRTLRQEIYKQLSYTCSAGVACNKALAKLAAGRNKPNGQTVLGNASISFFLSDYKFTTLRGLGGKLGQEMLRTFDTDRLSDLLQVSLQSMRSKLGSDAGSWVYHFIRGVDDSPVVSRTQIQSMLSQKTFYPRITCIEQAERWLQIFAADIMGRLEDQVGRRPTTVTVSHHIDGRFGPTRTKQAAIPPRARIDTMTLVNIARTLLQKISDESPSWPCLTLSLRISNFEDAETSIRSIASFLTPRKRTYDNFSSIDEAERNHIANECPRSTNTQIEQTGVSRAPVWHGQPHLSSARDFRRFDASRSDREATAMTSNSASIKDLVYSCPHCEKDIEAKDVLEHLDWHVARSLQHQP
jgi:DNA polymerase eta